MNGTVHTDREAFREVAAAAPAGARVPVEVRAAVDDPFDAFRRARDGPGGFFYETTGGQSGWGYFGIDPAERLTVSESVAVADSERAGGPAGSTGDYRRPTPTLAALEGVVDGETLVRGDCSVPYPCGVFGWLSYDVARELESFPAAPPTGQARSTTAASRSYRPPCSTGSRRGSVRWRPDPTRASSFG